MSQFDIRLEDDELLDEVELTANLIVAANQSDAALSTHQIDAILGLQQPTGPPDERAPEPLENAGRELPEAPPIG